MTTQPQPIVLFVDDNAANRRALQWVFREAGFTVREAATGTEALRLAAEKPDLIILDVNLPDIDGFEVCQRIRRDPATASVPVLHLSAYYTQSADKIHGLESGADGYIVKPVEPRELIAQARALLRVHQAEESARAAARQWQATFDAIGDGICLLDRHGTVLRCNPAAARILGRPANTMVGYTCHDLFLVGQGPGEAPVFGRMLESRRRETAEVERGDRWLRIVADPLVGGSGDLDGAVYIFSDITEHRRLEAQLRQAQKMDALGRLAGGIAHDFNNLLTAITGNISLLLAGMASADHRRELLDTIDKAAWRAAELTRQLLDFSRQSPLQLRPTRVSDCLEEVIGILRRTLDPRIVVERRYAPGLWVVAADAGQINQVVLNLCLNARDAMPEGGLLLLEVENSTLDDDYARASAGPSGGVCALRIIDTGCGIPSDILPRIFEPFFTTKPIGKGTGLGLAVVSGIIQEHQGWIECASTIDRGTCFTLYLPRSASATASAPPTASAAGRGGNETILLVDDEALLLALGKKLLERYGYRMLLARDGQEAVELYTKEKEQIDLVLLNWNLPGLSGPEAVRRLLQINPQVRILIVSGNPDGITPEAELQRHLEILKKPYREQDLARAVRSILDRHPEPKP